MFGIYLIIGAFAGILAGMLGVGGGIIVVPALAAVFLHFKLMPVDYVMHMAIGTSLATIMITLLSALRAQLKQGAVRKEMVAQLMPWLIIGTLTGAVVAHDLPSHYLKIFFGIFLIYVAYRVLFTNLEDRTKALPTLLWRRIVASIIGVLCSILGAGGGTMLIPLLLRCELNMREATGTSTACSIGVAFVSTVSFMLLGMSVMHLPWSTGYVYWPAFLGIAASSVLFAPVGTAIAYKLPTSVLKRLFGLFLLVVAIEMLIPV
ncbi:MAG: sulfite exporter TauE/SafE family protein [Gammaproteobacteria bacterium]|nr:sulfite exporter TauE/SafE family protein [Gammaproteobacteria bacterium]